MVIPLALTTFRSAKIQSLDEEKLRDAFERLANHDIAALETVYDLCANDVYALALWSTSSPADASDIVQEVFLKLAKRRGSLISVRKPRNYIFQMTQRLGIDFHRQRRRRIEREEPIEFLQALFAEDPVTGEERRQLRNAIAKLQPKQRETIYLHYFAGLSYSEIAEICDVNLFTAAGRCRLAILRLRTLLRKK